MDLEYKITFNKRVFDRLQIPIIDIMLMGKYHSFLLDTGANNNALDREIYNQLKNEHNLKEAKEKIQILTSSHVTQEVRELVELPLIIENKELLFPFTITDLTILRKEVLTKAGAEVDGLLGSRFFDHYKWILDFKEWAVWKY